MNRREFVKQLASTLAAAGFAGNSNAGIFSSIFGSTSGGLADIMANAVLNDFDVEYKVVGSYIAKQVINHYLPVAFVEIVNSPTDSLVLGTDTISGAYDMAAGNISLSNSGDSYTMGARIWSLPESARSMMLTPICKYCGDTSALFAPEQGVASVISAATSAKCFGGNALGALLGKLQDSLLAMSPLACIPQVYYDSNLDPNWTTNCHDMEIASTMAIDLGLDWETACSTGSSDLLSSILGRFGISAGDALNPCIGSWSTLFPRQAMVNEANPTMAAAITAYRALHLAAYYYGTFPYTLNLAGKFKMVYPFSSGTPFEIGSAAGRAGAELIGDFPGNDYKYGFVYMTPVTCTKFLSSMAGACIPLPPCTGNEMSS